MVNSLFGEGAGIFGAVPARRVTQWSFQWLEQRTFSLKINADDERMKVPLFPQSLPDLECTLQSRGGGAYFLIQKSEHGI